VSNQCLKTIEKKIFLRKVPVDFKAVVKVLLTLETITVLSSDASYMMY